MAELILQDKAFKQIKNSNFLHDIWLTRVINESGLQNITMREGETPTELAERYTREAMSNPRVLDLFGGLIIPAEYAPEDWTPELAKTTADFIGRITDPATKRLLWSQVASMVADFFLSGVASLKISPKSSRQDEAVPNIANVG